MEFDVHLCAMLCPEGTDSYSFPGREGKEPDIILDPFALKETIVLFGPIFFFFLTFTFHTKSWE